MKSSPNSLCFFPIQCGWIKYIDRWSSTSQAWKCVSNYRISSQGLETNRRQGYYLGFSCCCFPIRPVSTLCSMEDREEAIHRWWPRGDSILSSPSICDYVAECRPCLLPRIWFSVRPNSSPNQWLSLSPNRIACSSHGGHPIRFLLVVHQIGLFVLLPKTWQPCPTATNSLVVCIVV